MDAENFGVVNEVENVNTRPSLSSQVSTVANKETEKSETPPPVEHVSFLRFSNEGNH